MTDKLRAAAKAAYKAMIAAELSDGSKREWDAAVDGLKDALAEPEEKLLSIHRLDQWLKASLAEPTVQESLTVAEQEPVAWMVYTLDGQSAFVTDCPTDIQKDQRALPLYTAPPRREWVGLTREDITEIWLKTFDAVATDNEAYRAIEAKLREKNT